MRLKLFRAGTMFEGLAQVRAELGPDALILSHRSVGDLVEITAALEPNDEPAVPDAALLAALDYHGVPASLRTALQAGPLDAALARTMTFAPLPLSTGGSPLVLTGPPGAGKTLTVARIATRLVMSGVKPLIVTSDGKRAGATEQLAAFTRVLGLTLLAASHPVAVARALARRADGEPVLIDAPGCDPFEAEQIEELTGLVASANATLVLVLPAGLDPGEAAELGSAFAAAGAGLMVPTRLDLVRRLGGVLAAAAAGRLALTEAGVGPGAADGLEPLTPAGLAARMLAPRGKSS
ncbi:MAG: GTP-binding protein [Acetobacteraceae bacterium]|nr:GTP-binding protein [Acetobacteraceae bacterium]